MSCPFFTTFAVKKNSYCKRHDFQNEPIKPENCVALAYFLPPFLPLSFLPPFLLPSFWGAPFLAPVSCKEGWLLVLKKKELVNHIYDLAKCTIVCTRTLTLASFGLASFFGILAVDVVLTSLKLLSLTIL